MNDTTSLVSPLVSYALQGLHHCWMPERGRFSYRYRFDAAGQANESLPELDTFYTLNVLLGLSRVPPSSSKIVDVADVYATCCDEAGDPRWRIYTYGMALWAAAKLGISPPGRLIDATQAILADRRKFEALTAQDIGMLTSGAIAMTLAEGNRWRSMADRLAERIRTRYHHPTSNLFFNQGNGLRRAFSSFASQVYSSLALYQYGEAFQADWALRIAKLASSKLISLQGPRGEWAWFYYVPGGQVVDFYEVYSVHQHGMAPAFLHHAVAHDVVGARDALVKGFLWLFGTNEMEIPMLRPAEHMFYRSQVRKGELQTTWPRLRRSAVNTLSARSDSVRRHLGLELRRECRSYELGWILWSFGNRPDYAELALRPEFGV